MKFRIAAAALSFATLAAGVAEAQLRGPEITVGLASVGMETYDGDENYTQLFAPTSLLRLAFYFTPQVAIEPQVMLDMWSGEGRSGSAIGLGAFVPIYFNGDQGNTGLYAAPGIGVTFYANKQADGIKSSSSQTFFAVELGKKFMLGESASLRLAAQYFQEPETDDFFEFRNIGVLLGLSVFLK